MSRGVRIARNVAIAAVALIVTLVLALLLVVRTGWFRDYVRRTIVSGVEESTGGRVEVGSFDFDDRHLRAIVRNFVIHGTEPSNAPPFVSVPFIEVDLRLFTSLKRLYEISYLGIDRPAVNVSLQADGRSNIPTPRHKSASNKSALETVVDLAVGKFVLNNGELALFSIRQPLTIRGNHLRARLDYSFARRAYDGELGLEPIYVVNGRNTPVNFTVALPVTLTRDRIDFHHATITTPLSQISADGSIANMNNPEISTHVQGRIAGADLVNAGNIPVSDRKALPNLELDADATADANTIKVAALHIGLGNSNVEASGTLKDPRGKGSLQLRARLALRELGQLAGLSSRPAGTVSINATARLDSANRYAANGNVEARDLSFTQGKQRISNLRLLSAFHADPKNLDLNGLRLGAFGGEFAGNVSLVNFEHYKLDGRLRGFGIQPALKALGESLPYTGSISGPIEAEGDAKAAGTKSIVANAHLAIAPGRSGMPVSGRLNARYNGAADDVVVENSSIGLPHTRLALSGSLSKRLNLSLTSKDLHDLLAAVPSNGPSPVALTNGGQADFAGTVTGALSKPRIMGQLAINRFAVEGRQFDSFSADLAASNSAAAIANAVLIRNSMQAHADASIALRNWSPESRSTLKVNGELNNGDLADVMALAGQPAARYSGAVSASAQITGTYGNPIGAATIQASNGIIADEPFNKIQFQVDLADQFVNLPVGYIDTPAGRVDFKAEFRHPRDSFSTGQVHAHVQSGTLDLSRMTAVEKATGPSAGTLTIKADIDGALREAQPPFVLSAVDGDVAARAVRIRGVSYGDLTAAAHTSGQNVAYNLTSNFAGANIQATGTTSLTKDYPTNADLRIASLPVERALAAANETSIPARGLLSGSAHVSGTIDTPQVEAQIDLSKAVVYDEKIDDARMRIAWLARSVDVPQLEIVSGPSRIDATAHYDHPAGSLESGQARFTLTGNRLDLARSAAIQKYRAGLGGILDVSANGSANLQMSNPRVLLTAINANISATGIAAGGKQFGDLKLTANTQPGANVIFALDSNLAGATIKANGKAALNSQYPIDAQLSFHNIAWSRIADLTGHSTAGPPMFDATTEGDIAVRGPLLDTKQLNGSLDVTKLNVTTIPRSSAEKPITIANQGPIQLSLDHGLLAIRNAHLTGPKTDLQATGSASVTGENLNLNLRANVDLGVMQNFERDLYSAGTISLATTVRGDLPKPLITGQLTVQNAAVNMAAIPVGISNANGAIVFNGNSAQIKSLTGESGGGRVSISGFASFAEVLRFGLRTDATNVRVRVQQGVTITADAGIRVAGTADDSRVTGTVTVNRVSYASQSDFGSLLRRSAPPVQSAEAPSPLLANMRLEIRVRNSPGMTVQSSLSEDLQADVDLRVRGTADQPGVQGRVNISEGKLVFFGTTYSVDTGSISFYNPLRIVPVLDVSLEAQVQGVNVTLHVTGPIDNMKLSYTSDPPLQFQEIVSLLASGKTPTSDPTLLANQPTQPDQGFQQMGESAIVGQVVGNPVANQLQRVFGVTQLKIDPTFTTGSDVPTARLALQQRITNNLTFTYVQAIDQPNSTVIRAEWAFSPQWSAVATRDQNGLFSLNFLYKRGFR